MREAIKRLGPLKAKRPNQGLVFDTRCGDLLIGNDDVQRNLVEEVAGLDLPLGYDAFLRRWRDTLLAADDTLIVRAATGVKGGRVVVGLGGESLIETAMTFHRTYGVPYIPGSALKGLARAFCRNRLDKATWGPDSEAFKTLFGHQDPKDPGNDAAGYVTFHDALPAPAKFELRTGQRIETGVRVHPDVMTPHHTEYYQQNKGVPADWDSPTPVPFVSASGTFLLAVSGPPGWREVALQILGLALEREGIGGKTASGYGRLEVEYADAGVPSPDLPVREKDEPLRATGLTVTRTKGTGGGSTPAKNAQASAQPQAGKPAAPAAPQPSGTAEEFLKEVKGLKPADRRDAQKLQAFVRGGMDRFSRLPEPEKLLVAKALWAQVAGAGKQGEYGNLPLFREVKRLLGK
jgi:CRISPR-associated protein Cmr6